LNFILDGPCGQRRELSKRAAFTSEPPAAAQGGLKSRLNCMQFDYGDLVRVDTADQSHSGRAGSIVGITPVETDEEALHFKSPKGTVLYTVEFGDGSDALIHESSLVALDE